MCGKATRDDANAASDSLPRGSGGPPLIQISLRSPLIFYTDKSLERCEEVVWGAGWTDGTQRAGSWSRERNIWPRSKGPRETERERKLVFVCDRERERGVCV